MIPFLKIYMKELIWIMNNRFGKLVQSFLTSYIIGECNYSINTKASYSTVSIKVLRANLSAFDSASPDNESISINCLLVSPLIM